MGLFLGGLFLGMALGIGLLIIISACVINNEDHELYNKSFTIGQILKLKVDLNNDAELKNVNVNIGIDKYKLVTIIVDAEITHDILTNINRNVIKFEDMNKISLDYIIVTNEQIKKNDIKFKYYI